MPETGIVDYIQVVAKMAELLQQRGVRILTGAGVTAIRRQGSALVLETAQGAVEAKHLVNCAGLHSDRVAALMGVTPEVRIIPFRGEYYMLRPERRSIVRGLIYPVPDPEFPFLGVHFTRTIHGDVEAGPNAVLAFAREGYTLGTVRPGEFLGTLGYAGFWHMARKYWRVGAFEMYRSASKAAFVRSLQKLVPDIAGVRSRAGRGGGARAGGRAGRLPDRRLQDQRDRGRRARGERALSGRHRVAGHRAARRGRRGRDLRSRRRRLSGCFYSCFFACSVLDLAQPVFRGQHARRQVPDQRDGQRRIRPHEVIEAVGGNDHEGDRVGGDRGGRARRVPEQRDVPEQLALGERAQQALLAADLLADVHPADVHHERLALGVVALAKDDVAGLECPGRYFPDRPAHGS